MNQLWRATAKRTVPLGLICLVLALLTPGIASAGFAEGNDEVNRGAGAEGGAWDATLHPDYLNLYVSTSPALASNRCLDTFFDWRTSSGHWDGRVVRNCRPDAWRDSNNVFREDEAGAAKLEGAKTAGGCIFFQQNDSYSNGGGVECTKMDGALNNADNGNAWGWGEVDEDKFLHMWIRWQGGEVEVKSGGNAWDDQS